MQTVQPRYPHDCDQCRFVGQFVKHDVWICRQGDPTGNSLIARYGAEGAHYASSADFDLRTQTTIRQEIGGLSPDQVLVLALVRLLPSLILNLFTPAEEIRR